LMSRSSVNKPNPRKEPTLAHNLARERGEPDFLIPLNVDGMKPTELDWMTTDLTFIPFSRSWADGIAQLLKKLQSIGARRPLRDGRRIAAQTFRAPEVVPAAPEPVYTNCLPVVGLPATPPRGPLAAPPPAAAPRPLPPRQSGMQAARRHRPQLARGPAWSYIRVPRPRRSVEEGAAPWSRPLSSQSVSIPPPAGRSSATQAGSLLSASRSSSSASSRS